MSFVAEVLLSTGKIAKEDISLKSDDLKRKVEDIKVEVLDGLKNHYIDFSTQYGKLDKLIGNLNSFTSEHDILRTQIEREIKPQMRSSVIEFNDVLEDVKRTKKLTSVALNIALLHQHLENARKALTFNSLQKASEHLIDFENILNDFEESHRKDIDIVKVITNEFFNLKEKITVHLENTWHTKISFTNTLDGKKKCYCVKFNEMIGKEDVVELLIALSKLNQLHRMLKEFGIKFLNSIIEPILLKTTRLKMAENLSMLTVIVTNVHSPELVEVFEKLIKVMVFLSDAFFNLPIEEENKSVMSELGLLIGDEFCSLVIDNCLKTAIPKRSIKLEGFRKDMNSAESFCFKLQELKFIPESGNKLLNFIHEVDTLPVEKMAQDIMTRARSLMEKSLHQTVSVGTDSIPVLDNEIVIKVENSNELSEITNSKDNINKATFSFPRCQISESIKSLVQLLHEVKEEAKNIGPAHSSRLYYVARNICELYCGIVPIYHRDEILHIPQQTAIYHNNCMYLAHHLASLGAHYEVELQSNMKITFLDLVQEIRKLGAEAFLAQMRHQKQQILQLMQEQQAYGAIMVDNVVVNKAEKALRQCLYQLQLLKKVWSDVLPTEVYFKAVGMLFNTCMEELILRILSIEDIGAEASAKLDSIFDILLKQGPDLFKVPSVDKSNDIYFYAKRWYKFQELQLVLSASMREIVDRWASGKGPLATHFTSEEIKHLIRALFQNTERRAAALAKIR